MGRSYYCGSPWKIHVRGLIHDHVSLHNWTLSYSRTVSQQQTYVWPQKNDLLFRCDRVHYRFTLTSPLWFFRQNGLGYTSFMARLGVSISPLIMLLEDVWHLLPAVIYCAVAVVSGLVTSLLPETLNTRLPECVEDIEKPR